ncbi:MAG: flavodoxin-dependent (E)-4-hydroxy-3-methylbut-2-enyl-diphosphate synthase [Clostridiales bacterium]|nr:flavodoxin-dependent (E)-4-hydroxy-3-methylbut-2-enyl-diphosphate synthase [Clostridiales bacterium]
MTRKVKIGSVTVGGGAPIAIQSMTNTDTKNSSATLLQIEELYRAGCEIVRCSFYDTDCARGFKEITENSPIPVVADIHFDPQCALMAIENGAAKIRINPGNIQNKDQLKSIASALREHSIPVRVGSNSGSISKKWLKELGRGSASLAESAIEQAKIFEDLGVENIVISAKSSNVREMIETYEYISKRSDHPLHIGVTEAGDVMTGAIKNAIGIGSLLMKGIGDTVRVSLTSSPVNEIYAARDILQSVGLRNDGIEFISCPTCARTTIDIEGICAKLKAKYINSRIKLKVAVMGCVVNGPGEAADADLAIMGNKGKGVVFIKGIPQKTKDINEAIADLEFAIEEKIKENGCIK